MASIDIFCLQIWLALSSFGSHMILYYSEVISLLLSFLVSPDYPTSWSPHPFYMVSSLISAPTLLHTNCIRNPQLFLATNHIIFSHSPLLWLVFAQHKTFLLDSMTWHFLGFSCSLKGSQKNLSWTPLFPSLFSHKFFSGLFSWQFHSCLGLELSSL